MRTVVIVIVVLVVLIGLCAGVCVGLPFLGVYMVKGVIQDAAQQALAGNEVVEEKIGTIESVTWNMMASGQAGENKAVFDLKGSKGTAQLITDLASGDSPTLSNFVLKLPDGEEIQLDIGAPAPEPATR